jgi:hypothetical protein
MLLATLKVRFYRATFSEDYLATIDSGKTLEGPLIVLIKCDNFHFSGVLDLLNMTQRTYAVGAHSHQA